ncbi:hypothetical protein JDV02_002094 [Purpureocillium takamizusanense]|uniref:Zn(2)-C6 fungal-type domain-containing protein n=1 Tax=Purpureocillium takamizusanense TaxID=2060973 RepID=A0A9Q8Q9K2_9HYPO|nr:uncharacterized protein JDV02_002094 [Purpureocillium takamizusanense]UNI15570.1 hypothetical protein JDV02_002094 [Purpureocillium takamizusanense]
MFAVWKYGTEADNVQHIRQAADPGAFTRLQACNRCHTKKIKCSGDKDGCVRCLAAGHACDYNRSTLRFRKSKSPEGSTGNSKSSSSSPFSHRRSTSSSTKHERRRSGRVMQPTPPPSTTGSPAAGFANAAFPTPLAGDGSGDGSGGGAAAAAAVSSSTTTTTTTLAPMDAMDMICPPMGRSVPFSLYGTQAIPSACYDGGGNGGWPSYVNHYSAGNVSGYNTEYLQLLQPRGDPLDLYNLNRSVSVWPQ